MMSHRTLPLRRSGQFPAGVSISHRVINKPSRRGGSHRRRTAHTAPQSPASRRTSRPAPATLLAARRYCGESACKPAARERPMIGIDWGTTSFRAFRVARDGGIRDRRASPRGIMNVPDNRFAETLRDEIGPWLAAGEDRVLLSGMIGSRQGWKEAPYVRCPAGAAELSAALVDVPFDGAQVKLVPGMNGADQSGIAEVMRGEETQVVGALAVMNGNGLACLP